MNVYKYTLNTFGRTEIKTESYMEPLSVGVQGDNVVLYGRVYDSVMAGKVSRWFTAVPTGKSDENADFLKFIGTVSITTPRVVQSFPHGLWIHVFEVGQL